MSVKKGNAQKPGANQKTAVGPMPPPAGQQATPGSRTQLPPGFQIHTTQLKRGIGQTEPFAEKGLAQFGVNVGLKCGHDCTYCSSGAMLRTHAVFKQLGVSPFNRGYAIIDPNTVARVARDAKSIARWKRGMVQLCTTTDAWSPEAQSYKLGRGCLKAILAEPWWTVRILTKNAAVVNDYDVCRQHRDRVLVGLSLTAPPAKQAVMQIIEPNASPITARMSALYKAHRKGLRTYAMLCPLLPGIWDNPVDIQDLVSYCHSQGAEEIFAEAVNPRGKGLLTTQQALEQNGFPAEAMAVGRIRNRKAWSAYVADLVVKVQIAVRCAYGNLDKLRFLLYGKDLQPADRARIKKNPNGVIWLS